MKNFIVTGGCGFIGSHLVELLLSKEPDAKIFVIDNMDSGKIENIVFDERVQYLFKDVRHILEEREELKEIDTIFHLGARARIQPSFNEPNETVDVNVRGTSVVCELARVLGAKIVYAGSSSFYGGVYLNPYSFTKWQGEEVCKMYSEVYGLSVAIARFFNVYGPRHPKTGPYGTVVGVFERQFINKKPLTITGDGEQRRDFTHVLDIVSGLHAMSLDNHTADIYNLGTGTNHSINELASLFGTEASYVPKRRGEAWTTLADISKAKNELKWEPTHKLENYVKRWLSEQ
jgi:UDP-glucose 4-epimerase